MSTPGRIHTKRKANAVRMNESTTEKTSNPDMLHVAPSFAAGSGRNMAHVVKKDATSVLPRTS